MSPPPLFAHQERDATFTTEHPRVFNTSDPGTGKTRTCIEAISRDCKKRTLIFAPKSILQPSWGDDILRYAPHLRYSVAHATNRERAFKAESDIVITNHDAVNWVAAHPEVLSEFDRLIVDESTAYKNGEAKRSQNAALIARQFEKRVLLTGTPNPNGVLDLWHQTFILDEGERLGRSFFKFRSVTCEPRLQKLSPKYNPKTGTVEKREFTTWAEKDGALDAVAALLQDITIRNRMEDCLDIPPNHVYSIEFELSKEHRQAYEAARELAVLQTKEGLEPLKAAGLTNKLLQIASGAVYMPGKSHTVATERYSLVLDLVEAREQSVVAFNWKHQRDELIAEAQKRKIPYAVIDGEASSADRTRAVEQFQAGLLQVIFAHPQSAGHGLTLTRGTATIWASPTYNLEHYAQFNRRIYRAGQTKKTETILVCAHNTVEADVYAQLERKDVNMQALLELMLS